MSEAGPGRTTKRKERHALWLIPTGEPFARLAGTIRRLAREHGGPVFEPHVTLLGGMVGEAEAMANEAARLAAVTKPIDLRLRGIGFRAEFFRCLFLRVAKTEELTSAHERAAEIFPPRRKSPYVPHLSLIYADLEEGTKRRIAADLGETLETSFTVSSIHLVSLEGQPDTWRPVREFDLR